MLDAPSRPVVVSSPRLVAVLAAGAAVTPLLFSIAFFVLLPARGLDLGRFGEPAYMLELCAANPLLFRAICINNAVLLLCAMLVASALPRHLSPRAESTRISADLACVGWLLYLVGEMADFTAYLGVPGAYRAGVAEAPIAFLPLQHLGRITHMFGYAVIGVGMLGLAAAVQRATPRWPRSLVAIGYAAAAASVALFAIDCFSTTLAGDAGAGGAFNLVLGIETLLLAAWHGGLGVRLWTRGR